MRPSRAGTVLYCTAGVLATVVFIVPLLWTVVRSLQPASRITAAPSWGDLGHLTFANYHDLFAGDIGLWRFVVNSLVVASGTAVLTALLCTLAGCGFAKFRFRGSA